jgi:tetratricopeptide (TPR) repeat protein
MGETIHFTSRKGPFPPPNRTLGFHQSAHLPYVCRKMAAQAYRRPCWRTTLLVLLLSFSMCVGAHAQYGAYSAQANPAPDSTVLLLDSAKSIAAVAPAQALPLLNRALESAILHHNPNGEARAHLAIGEVQLQLNHAAEAKESLLKCKRLFGTSIVANLGNNSTFAGTTTNSSQPTYAANRNNLVGRGMDAGILLQATRVLTSVYEDAGQFKAAYEETESSLELLPNGPGNAQRNAVLRTQARLLSKLGKKQQATDAFQQLLDAERKAGDAKGECETRIEMGEHYQRNGDANKAKEQFEKAIALAQAGGFQAENIHAGQALATIYQAEGDFQNELAARNAVVALTQQNNDVENNYLQNIAIGNAYLNANQPELAAQFVDAGVDKITANEIKTVQNNFSTNIPTYSAPNSTELQVGADAYRQLAEGYLKKSELQKSLEYYKKYAVLQDSVKEVHARELADAIALSKDLGKNEARVQLLERERSLSDQSIALLQQDQEIKADQIFTRNLIIGILIASLIVMIGVGIVLVRNTRARRRADKLLALQSMTGQMNPHFIFNALNSVNEFISQNDERAANRYLTAFSRLMRKVMDDSKQMFIPITEEISMLQLYLELEHARFKDQFEYRFEVDEALENSEFELPPMMVQPYIENAIWHGLRYRSGGGHLFIHFLRNKNELQITIQDDGIGIAQSKAIKTAQQKRQHSMGMKNIVTRIGLMNEIYGLEMTVAFTETHPGEEHPGTTVRITIPQSPKGKIAKA